MAGPVGWVFAEMTLPDLPPELGDAVNAQAERRPEVERLRLEMRNAALEDVQRS